jgi:hypothetical protein
MDGTESESLLLIGLSRQRFWTDTGCDNELLFKAVVGQLRGDTYSLFKSNFSSGQSMGHRKLWWIFLNSNLEISTQYKTFEQKF